MKNSQGTIKLKSDAKAGVLLQETPEQLEKRLKRPIISKSNYLQVPEKQNSKVITSVYIIKFIEVADLSAKNNDKQIFRKV